MRLVGVGAGPGVPAQFGLEVGVDGSGFDEAELARATARAAAADAVSAGKGRRAGRPVQPREISFTAARRAVIAATRSSTATLPAALTRVRRDRALADLARRRAVIDRDRHQG